jgi:tRNA A-37 threonylcarbamoyl transferase component Bud32
MMQEIKAALVILILFFVSSSGALQCYYGSNTTTFSTCEASDPEVCLSWIFTCFPGSKDLLCQDLHLPNENVSIFRADCLPCKDNVVHKFNPTCCTTEYCNGPPGYHQPPFGKAPTSTPKKPPSVTDEDDKLTTSLLMFIAGTLLFAAFLLSCKLWLRDLKKKKLEREKAEAQGLLNEMDIEQGGEDSTGSFSIVRKVEKDGKKYAVKKILTTVADLYEEYKIIVQLEHRNIVKAFEFNAAANTMPGLWMEYCDYSLAEKMHCETLSDIEVLSYIIQLASAVIYIHFKLHDKVVIHCDICPRNILLVGKHEEARYMDTMLLKLADFGMAKILNLSEDPAPKFIASELDNGHRNKIKDVWTAKEAAEKHTYSIFTDLHSFAVVCTQIMLKKIVTNETKLLLKLRSAPIKLKAPYVKEIATFCAEILDKSKKQLSNANEVKVKLENLKKVLKSHYKLMASQNKPNDEQPLFFELFAKNGIK